MNVKAKRASWYELARSAWPAIVIPADDFTAYLLERTAESDELAPNLLQDLYLACGCARGDPAALALFRERYVNKLLETLPGSTWPRALVEDVLQDVQLSMLVAKPGEPPRITQYSGGASLLMYVRIAAVHELRKRAPKAAPEPDCDWQRLADEILPAKDDPELQVLVRRYLPEIQAAVADAVQSFEPVEQTLIKLSVVDGLSTVKLAALHGVNQSTMWRRLERIKEELNEKVHALLKQRLKLSPRDLESMVNALRSSLHLSLSQIFKKRGPAG